jgi:hypothetical protein
MGIDWIPDWLSSNIQFSDPDHDFQDLVDTDAPERSHSTARKPESDVFASKSLDCSPDWISSNIELSDSDHDIRNLVGSNGVGVCAGIPLQERIDFFEGLENVGIEDTPYSATIDQTVQPASPIETQSSEYGTGLTINSSLARQIDIAGMFLISVYQYDRWACLQVCLLEEFGPVETYRGYQVIWDNATAVVLFVRYNVLVCTQCKRSLTSSGIGNHIRSSHYEVESAAGNSLEQKYAHVLLSPSEIPNPPHNSCPIPFLPIVDGFSCPSCDYCIANWTNMARHLRTDHGLSPRKNDLPCAKLQTWYSGQHARYFRIHENKCSSCSGSAVSESGQIGTPHGLNRVELQLEAQLRLLNQTNSFCLQRAFPTPLASTDPYETRPLGGWLEKTRWAEHFQRIELARVVEIREELANQVKKDGALFMVHQAAGLVLQRCNDLIPNVSHALLCLVRQVLSGVETNIPFRRPQTAATHKRYMKCWQDFVCFLVFQSAPVFGPYHLGMLRLTGVQRDLLSQITSLLPNSITAVFLSPETFPQDHMSLPDLIVNLSLACIEQNLSAGAFDSPLIHYLAVLGINENNCAYHDAYSYTGYLASIAYCTRLLMIQSCVHLSNASLACDVQVSPCDVFQQQKAKFMICNRESPMSIVLDQLGYGMAIQKGSQGRQLVIYCEDSDELIFAGNPIRVDMIRGLLRDILSRAKDVLTQSLFVPENFEDSLQSIISTLRDNTSCAQNGASLASQNPRVVEGLQAPMIKQFLMTAYSHNGTTRSGKIFIPGTEKISPKVRFQFEESRVLFLEYLLLLMHITGGGPARGTEMCTLQFANSHLRHRNVFFLAGELLFVTSYHKGQSRYGTQRYIPRFLPPVVGRLLLAYLLYLLPFESVYLAQLYAWPQLSGERTHMLWSSSKGLWDTERLTKVLTRECSPVLGMDVTTAGWRHISIAMMRLWVQNPTGCEEPEGENSKDSEDASELQAGHSTEVANLKYACRMDICNTLSSRSIKVFGAVSHDWHKFLKLREDKFRKPTKKILPLREPQNSDIWVHESPHMGSEDTASEPYRKRSLSNSFCASNGKRYVSDNWYFPMRIGSHILRTES